MKKSKRMRVRVYVEGAGDTRSSSLANEARQALGRLCESAGVRGVKIIFHGGRGQTVKAWKSCCLMHPDVRAVLLVDSEGPVEDHHSGFQHLQAVQIDWKKKWPEHVNDDDVHLMVQMMEAWLLSDPEALAQVFGTGFMREKIPAWPDLEAVPKATLLSTLRSATAACRAPYDKGKHSFKVLGLLDPDKLRRACPSADRFFSALAR